MNLKHYDTMHPTLSCVPSELTFAGSWDGQAVSELIHSKSHDGESPAFLFLGKVEADLLMDHLTEAWGPEAIVTLKRTYYRGLQVVVIDSESFVGTGGRKAIRTLQDPISRRPTWRDREVEALWQLRI